MANKKTVVQMYEELLAIPTLNAEQKAFIEKRIEITKKKNASKSAEPTAKQKEKMAADTAIENAIVGVMAEGATYTPSDIVKLLDNPNVPNTQKLTPRLTALVTAGVLSKEIVKGRSMYALVATADEE